MGGRRLTIYYAVLLVGVAAVTTLVLSAGGIVAAASDAGLLVVGLSDRWRQEGLGPTRSELASSAPAPILFVRRGERAGALAPREDTRFTWSSPGIAFSPSPSGTIS